MPPERKHPEMGADHRKRMDFLTKKKRPNNLSRTGYPKRPPQPPQEDEVSNSINSLKNRIRNLKRLLDHVDENEDNKMPVTVRHEHERELEALEHELSQKASAKKQAEFRAKIIGKYHHVRFFERQKATRTVKRLTKQLAALTEEPEQAVQRQKIHMADVDLNYTIYYPLLRPYVSLFPKPVVTAGNPIPEFADGPKGNVDIWKAVEKAMEDGTLEDLRNSKDGMTIPGPKDPLWNVKMKSRWVKMDPENSTTQEKVKAPKEKDDESDGGFFE